MIWYPPHLARSKYDEKDMSKTSGMPAAIQMTIEHASTGSSRCIGVSLTAMVLVESRCRCANGVDRKELKLGWFKLRRDAFLGEIVLVIVRGYAS